MLNPVIIFGAGSPGRIAKEIFESNDVVVYGFLDDDKKRHGTTIDEAQVLGATDDDGFLKLVGKKCDACIAVDNLATRKSLVKMLNDVRHVQPVTAAHRLAQISKRAAIGYGNLFDAGVVVAAGAAIGQHNVFHAQSLIGTSCTIGDYIQVGAGAIINPEVTIGDGVFIGAGAVIVAGVTIGAGARIGVGSVVVGPVKAGETVFGNPAQVVKT